jgi:hypothetical protein
MAIRERKSMIHLKKAEPTPPSVTQEIRDTVSKVLLEVERDGIKAVRKYSQQFDSWNPPSFHLSDAQIKQGLEGVTDEFAASIDFALKQVRSFARAQRATMHELELETLPGVTLGHKLIPVNSVGAYVPVDRQCDHDDCRTENCWGQTRGHDNPATTRHWQDQSGAVVRDGSIRCRSNLRDWRRTSDGGNGVRH